MSTIKDRLIQYLEAKEITKAKFGRTIGVSNAYITSIKHSIAQDKLQKIAKEYPDLNIEWLILGKGEMIESDLEPSFIDDVGGDDQIRLQDKIKELLRRKQMLHKEMCAAIGMSDAGMRKIYGRNSCELSTLKQIAEFFNVPMSVFLDDDSSQNTQDLTRILTPEHVSPDSIQELMNIVEKQRKRIEYLTDMIFELLKR